MPVPVHPSFSELSIDNARLPDHRQNGTRLRVLAYLNRFVVPASAGKRLRHANNANCVALNLAKLISYRSGPEVISGQTVGIGKCFVCS
jgi:hypothetical protein